MRDLKELQDRLRGKNFNEVDSRDKMALADCLVEREFRECMTDIVSNNLLKEEGEYDNIKNLYPDQAEQIEELEEQEAELKERLEREEKEHIDFDGTLEEISAVEEQLERNREKQEEPNDILEWWLISEWLYDKLEEAGEPVYTPNDFNYFWGRGTSGQSISMDYIIQKIAFENLI